MNTDAHRSLRNVSVVPFGYRGELVEHNGYVSASKRSSLGSMAFE
jgi:hypothetical protein